MRANISPHSAAAAKIVSQVADEVSRKLAYSVDDLARIPLPDVLTNEVVAAKVADSKLADKNPLIAAGPGEVLSDAERRAVTWQLAAYAAKVKPGEEHRLILPLAPGAHAPVGQVVLAYDARLNGAATLVGRGPALGGPPEHPDPAGLKAGLRGTYGIDVRGPWQPDELLKVSRALALLDAKEAATLAGIPLVRVGNVPEAPSDRVDGDGHTMAQYSYQSGPLVGTVGVIYVADRAFAYDGKVFYGGVQGVPSRPPSFQVILHEVGHVIDMAERQAFSRDNALAAVASLGDPHVYQPHEEIPAAAIVRADQVGVKNTTTAQDELVSLALDAFNGVVEAQRKNLDPQQRTQAVRAAADLVVKCRATGGVLARLADYLDAASDDRKAFDNAEALAERLQQEHTLLTGTLKLIRGVIAQINGGQLVPPGNFGKIAASIADLTGDPWTESHAELVRWCELQRKEADWRLLYARAGRHSTERREHFAQFVGLNTVPVDLTVYAERYWERSPEEFLCEAFAIWKVDPVGLRGHSAELRAYFDEKSHLLGGRHA